MRQVKDFFGRDREMRPEGEASAMDEDWDGDTESLLAAVEADGGGGGAAAVADGGAAAAAAVADEGRGDFSPELFDEDEIEEEAEVRHGLQLQ